VKGGTVFWLGVVLLCLAALALMCFRPARVVGVSEKALAYSLRSANNAGQTGECEGAEERWRCTVYTSGGTVGSGVASVFKVEVDGWGCWDATEDPSNDRRPPMTLEGCITIADLVRLGD